MQTALATVEVPRDLTTRPTHGGLRGPTCLAAFCAPFLASAYLGTLAAAAITLAVLVLLAARCAFRSPAVRTCLDRQAGRRAYHRREARRLALLASTGRMREEQYLELRRLVQSIAPSDAARFELQDLLDEFVRLAVTHRRCSQAIDLTDAPSHGPVRRSAQTDSAGRPADRRVEIRARRDHHREQCLGSLLRLSEDIEAVQDLVRLIVDKTVFAGDVSNVDREIDSRLAELDALDEAMDQVSADARR
jgi:hypothetical protein